MKKNTISSLPAKAPSVPAKVAPKSTTTIPLAKKEAPRKASLQVQSELKNAPKLISVTKPIVAKPIVAKPVVSKPVIAAIPVASRMM